MTQCLYANSGGTWKKVILAYRNIKNMSYTQSAYLYYDCDTGTTIDISPNNFSPATFTGSITATSARRGGKDYRFDPGEGMDTNVSINMANNDVTICAWFWFASIPSSGECIFLALAPERLRVRITNRNLILDVKDNANNITQHNFGNYSQYFKEKEWVHIASTWDSSNKSGYLYVNSVYLGSKVIMSSGSTPGVTTMFRTPNSDNNDFLVYVDDPQIHLYRYTATDSTRWKLRYLMDGIGVWSEINKIYINDAGTWKRSHFSPYNGMARVNMTFSSLQSGDGQHHHDQYHNEAQMYHETFTLYVNDNKTVSRIYRGGITYVGYKIYSPVGTEWSMGANINLYPSNRNMTISCWARALNYNGVQRLITLHNEAMVLRFEGNKPRAYVFNTDGNIFNAYGNTLDVDTWYFLVARWNLSNKMLEVLCYNENMSLHSSGSVTLSGTIRDASSVWFSSNSAESLEGYMTLARVHDRYIHNREIPFIARETWGNG